MNRFQEFFNTCKHWIALNKISIRHGYYFPFHDVMKGVTILLLGDDIATKLHRRFSNHHLSPITGDIKNKLEAAFDWESARYTKPAKPLNGVQTWQKYYSQVDMAPVFRQLGWM